MQFQNSTPLSFIAKQHIGSKFRSRGKSNIQLKSELTEMKKQRNKDNEELKLLKVELGKLENTWKKYK